MHTRHEWSSTDLRTELLAKELLDRVKVKAINLVNLINLINLINGLNR